MEELKVLRDRVDDLEHEIARVDRKYASLHRENRKRVQSNRLLLYAFAAFVAAAMTGLSYQSGQLAYSFNSTAVDVILAALGLGGAAAGVQAWRNDGAEDNEADQSVELEE